MSDIEYYDNDEEYFEYDDFPFNEAEDLAGHTVQSPVLVNYDPTWETASFASDWEYYSDEYWEQVPSNKPKPKNYSIEDAEARRGIKAVKKKRRKSKLDGIPVLSLDEPSLAASSVVWKPVKETVESYKCPVVIDGQGEKVSFLTDWRERFELLGMTRPTSSQRKGKGKAVAADAGDSPAEEQSDVVLPAPPTTLDEMEDPPSNSRSTFPATREPAFKTNSMVAFPSYEVDTDVEEDVTEPNNSLESHDNERTVVAKLPDKEAVGTPVLQNMRGRPSRQKPSSLMCGRGNEVAFPGDKVTMMSNGKRRADIESSSSDDTVDIPSQNMKQGRPKRQKVSTFEAGQSESTEPASRPEKKSGGRPKKRKSLSFTRKVTRSDQATHTAPTEKKLHQNSPMSGPMESESISGSITTRSKRKAPNVEDQLDMPLSKRQNFAANDAKAMNTSKPIPRKGTRKR